VERGGHCHTREGLFFLSLGLFLEAGLRGGAVLHVVSTVNDFGDAIPASDQPARGSEGGRECTNLPHTSAEIRLARPSLDEEEVLVGPEVDSDREKLSISLDLAIGSAERVQHAVQAIVVESDNLKGAM
jgi:hypothetical protein